MVILIGGGCLATNDGNFSLCWLMTTDVFLPQYFSIHSAEPITDRGWKTHKVQKKYTPINKVSACVFYFSVKITENLITPLHSFVCLECHLLFSVMRFAKIALFPCQHLLSAGLDCLSLKATSLAPFLLSFPSTLFPPLSRFPFFSPHLKCFLGTHLSLSKRKDSPGLLLSSFLKGEEIQIIQNRAKAGHWHYQQMFLFPISRFCNF